MASRAVLELLIQMRDEASAGLGRVAGVIGNLGSAALTVGGGALLGVAGGLGAAGLAGLNFNNSMEIVTAQLNAFTKDGAKSAEILEMIKTRASQTPFAFEDMAKATTSLLPASKASGVALEDLIAQAEILAASNPAEGLEGAAFALKEAVGGDFLSLIERFNLPKQRLNELKAEGVPALEAVQIAMQELGLDADLVTGLANTASGRWSTFKDTLVGLAATASKPIFDMLSNGLADVNDWITANQPAIEAFATTIATNLASGIQFAVAAINTLSSTIGPLIEYFRAVVEDGDYLNDWLTNLPTSIQPAVQAIGQFVALLQSLGQYFAVVIEDGDYMNDFLTHLPESIQPIAQAVGELVAILQSGLKQAFDEGGAGIEIFSQVLAGLQSRWEAVIGAINEILPPLQALITEVFSVVGAFLDEHGAEILATLTSAWQQINEIINTVIEIIGIVVAAGLRAITAFMQAHGTEIKLVLSAAWEIIKNVITGALALIGGVVKAALALLRGDWQGAWEAIKTMSATFVQSLIGVIKGGLNLIAGLFGTTIGDILRTWQGIASQMVSIGKSIVDGIIRGVQSAGSALLDTMVNLASDALAAAADAIGMGSPAKEAMPIGASIISGLIVGVNGMLPQLNGVFTQVAAGLLAKAKKITDQVRDQVERIVADLEKQAADIGKQINSAIASGFESEASIDRLLAENLDAVAQFTGRLGGQVRQQLDEALRSASQFADPETAADWYKLRSDQILELADLQQRLGEELSKEERARIEQQIKLIEAAQQAERSAFGAQNAGKQGAVATLVQQLQALLGNTNLPGILDSPIIAQLTAMLQQLQQAGAAFTMPTGSLANSGPVSNRPEAPVTYNVTVNVPPGTSSQQATALARQLGQLATSRRA